MKKQKQTPLEQFMSNLIRKIGLLIQKRINIWKENHEAQQKFNKQVKNNIKKNIEYAKVKNAKRHPLNNDNNLY